MPFFLFFVIAFAVCALFILLFIFKEQIFSFFRRFFRANVKIESSKSKSVTKKNVTLSKKRYCELDFKPKTKKLFNANDISIILRSFINTKIKEASPISNHLEEFSEEIERLLSAADINYCFEPEELFEFLNKPTERLLTKFKDFLSDRLYISRKELLDIFTSFDEVKVMRLSELLVKGVKVLKIEKNGISNKTKDINGMPNFEGACWFNSTVNFLSPFFKQIDNNAVINKNKHPVTYYLNKLCKIREQGKKLDFETVKNIILKLSPHIGVTRVRANSTKNVVRTCLKQLSKEGIIKTSKNGTLSENEDFASNVCGSDLDIKNLGDRSIVLEIPRLNKKLKTNGAYSKNFNSIVSGDNIDLFTQFTLNDKDDYKIKSSIISQISIRNIIFIKDGYLIAKKEKNNKISIKFYDFKTKKFTESSMDVWLKYAKKEDAYQPNFLFDEDEGLITRTYYDGTKEKYIIENDRVVGVLRDENRVNVKVPFKIIKRHVKNISVVGNNYFLFDDEKVTYLNEKDAEDIIKSQAMYVYYKHIEKK